MLSASYGEYTHWERNKRHIFIPKFTSEYQVCWIFVPGRASFSDSSTTHPEYEQTPATCVPTPLLVPVKDKQWAAHSKYIVVNPALPLQYIIKLQWHRKRFEFYNHLQIKFQLTNLDRTHIAWSPDSGNGDLAFLKLCHDIICTIDDKCVSAHMRYEPKISCLPQVDDLQKPQQ